MHPANTTAPANVARMEELLKADALDRNPRILVIGGARSETVSRSCTTTRHRPLAFDVYAAPRPSSSATATRSRSRTAASTASSSRPCWSTCWSPPSSRTRSIACSAPEDRLRGHAVPPAGPRGRLRLHPVHRQRPSVPLPPLRADRLRRGGRSGHGAALVDRLLRPRADPLGAVGRIVSLCFFWLSYLDRFLDPKHSVDGASSVFFLGRKTAEQISGCRHHRPLPGRDVAREDRRPHRRRHLRRERGADVPRRRRPLGGPPGRGRRHPRGFRAQPAVVHRFYDARRAALATGRAQPRPPRPRPARGGARRRPARGHPEHRRPARAGRLDPGAAHARRAALGAVPRLRAPVPLGGDLGDLPPCPGCRDERLRPDVVWFGEVPYEMDRILGALERGRPVRLHRHVRRGLPGGRASSRPRRRTARARSSSTWSRARAASSTRPGTAGPVSSCRPGSTRCWGDAGVPVTVIA